MPVMAAHSISAGVAIGINTSCNHNIVPCASTVEEWADYLYPWQKEFVTRLSQDVRSLGCPHKHYGER